MKKLEKVFLIMFCLWTLLVIFGKASIDVALTIYIPLIVIYLICWLIRNSIEEKRQKQYSMIKNEKQENTEKQSNYNDGNGLNTVLYTGMNGKQVTLWKFFLGIILMGIGFWGSIMLASYLGSNWMG